MKVIILAGGFGTRLGHASGPKPMVKIGGKPIIYHIMKYYESYGFKEFVLALGYKANLMKKELKKYKFQIDFVDTDWDDRWKIKRLKSFTQYDLCLLMEIVYQM